jgi:hypothetical protein
MPHLSIFQNTESHLLPQDRALFSSIKSKIIGANFSGRNILHSWYVPLNNSIPLALKSAQKQEVSQK